MKILKNYRLSLGLSLRQAAKQIGLTHSTLANIEADKVDVGYKKINKAIEFYREKLGDQYHE